MNTRESGYSLVLECLSYHECDELAGILSAGTISRSRAGARHLMANPSVLALAKSRRLTKLAAHWLGCDAIPFRATLFDKSSRTNWLIPWHQDTALPLAERFDLAGWGPWSEKGGAAYAHAPAWALSRIVALRVHLDASTADNGPLRVIPGSHLAGVLSDQAVSEIVSANESAECCVPRARGNRDAAADHTFFLQSTKHRTSSSAAH